MSPVKSIPDGHRTVTPYLAIKNDAKALEFYQKAFGATETFKLTLPDGRVGHAEIRLGDSVIMLADEFPEYGGKSPQSLGGSPVSIHLYVEDVDAFFKKALAAGARERKPVVDQFYGDRSGQLEDPFGHLGGWPRIRKTSPRRKCRSACRRCSPGRRKMATKIFVNLPVKNLNASVAFFTRLGFGFDAHFPDETATCMIGGDDIFVMLLTRDKFKTFTPKEICDATKCTEVLVALSAESREKVDEIVRLAVAAGGTTYSDPQDHGFMYGHGFQDLDGHIWEILYMAPSATTRG